MQDVVHGGRCRKGLLLQLFAMPALNRHTPLWATAWFGSIKEQLAPLLSRCMHRQP